MVPRLFAVLALVALLPATPTAAETADAVSTAHAFIDAMNSGDPGAAAALFPAEGYIRTPQNLRQGAEQVVAWIEEHIGYHIAISPLGSLEVSGDRATWVATVVRDDWVALGIASIDVSYQATVQDGKIAALAFTFDPEQEAELRAAQAAARRTAAPLADTSPPAAAQPPTEAPASDPLPTLEVSVGAPPSVGWKWAVMKRANGGQEVLEPSNDHSNTWVFVVTRGSAELGVAEGNKAASAGEAMLIPARQAHTHRYAPETEILGVQLRPADRPPGDLHGGTQLFLSETPLETETGTDYVLRVRDFGLAPGERTPESTTVEPNFVYVIEGTLTFHSPGDSVTALAAGEVGTLPLNVEAVLSNEGNGPLRFVLVDLRP